MRAPIATENYFPNLCDNKLLWFLVNVQDILKMSPQPKIRWEYSATNDNLPIAFTGCSYMMLGKRDYICHQGPDIDSKKKEKEAQKRNNMFVHDHKYTGSRKHTQPTKKLGCPVTFSVKKIMTFPEVSISVDNKRNRTKAGHEIKSLLGKTCDGKITCGRLQYLVSFPTHQAHLYHNVGEAAGISESLDFRIENYLREQIRKGCKNVKDLSSRAQMFVEENLVKPGEAPDFYRRRFTPSRKKLRNLILSVKLKLQYSQVDQENVEHLADKWKNWGHLAFEPLKQKFAEEDIKDFSKKVGDEDDVDEVDDLEFHEMIKRLSTGSVEGKMVFCYQSTKMQRLYRRYAPSLIALDATYKTTKYALLLFFLVVRTNVNFQVVGVMVLQEETTAMIAKGLNIFKLWNPETIPKYAMVDFDEKEIKALETLFPNIKVFLCDFHREQSWTRWIAKADNGVFQFAEQVKVFLRRIAHSINKDDCNKAVSDFLNWEFCKGKLLSWFHNTWFPEIKRWSLAFRPNDLMFNNTNNGTERLNEDLKYDELANYKHCSLSEMLTVVIERFLPKHYRNYVELNVRYSEGFKKYHSNIPKSFVNRPKKLVVIMLENMSKVTDRMASSVRKLEPRKFKVKTSETWTDICKEYEVFLGNEVEFCYCTCFDYRRHRVLCKHFFAVFRSKLACFNEVTPLFLNHPWTVLDPDIFSPIQPSVITQEVITAENENEEEEEEIEQEIVVPEISSSSLITESNFEEDKEEFAELLTSTTRKKKVAAREKLKRLIDLTYELNDNMMLNKLNDSLDESIAEILNKVQLSSGLIQRSSPKKEAVKPSTSKKKKHKRFMSRPKRNPYIGRVGAFAEMMQKHYRVKVPVTDKVNETNSSKKTQTVEVVGMAENEIAVPDENKEPDVEFVKVVPRGQKRPSYRFNSKFTDNMTKEILDGNMLNDSIINHALLILHKQFPMRDGFDDTELLQKGTIKMKQSKLVILNAACHWITVLVENGCVNIFDSLTKSQNDISDEFCKQICTLIKSDSSELQFNIHACQQQENSIDCGVFAIAFIVDISFGWIPDERAYDINEMRKHLVSCLYKNRFSEFPQAPSKKRIQRCRSIKFGKDLFCICRQAFYESDIETEKYFMVECTNCKEWFHKGCLKIKKKFFTKKSEPFYCSKCS